MLNLSYVCCASPWLLAAAGLPSVSHLCLRLPSILNTRVSRKETSICPPGHSSIPSNRSARADVGAVYTARASLFDNNSVGSNAMLNELLAAVRELRECGWGHVRMFWIWVRALCSRYLSNKVLLRWTWYSRYSTHMLFFCHHWMK